MTPEIIKLPEFDGYFSFNDLNIVQDSIHKFKQQVYKGLQFIENGWLADCEEVSLIESMDTWVKTLERLQRINNFVEDNLDAFERNEIDEEEELQ